MKSQVIRCRNLPKDPKTYEKIINVKPVGLLIITLSLFCLIVMPDRDLCKFTKDYLVLYNRHNRDECSLIYWDEVVSWHYEWYKTYDQLVIEMIDGSTEIQDMYSIGSIKKSMDHHIPGKMKKNKHFRKDQR